jgi:hypothetical protein
LGDPPLSVADPQIEYLFKPSMSYRRLGNHIHYNAYSMRSEDFPAHRTSPDELRVMVIGDSVINGGALTDDSQLATKLLESSLSRDLNRPVVVGNISAASWGPPNELAYAKKFGLFDADVVVVVLSSHDYADVPTFKPVIDIDPSFPSHRPLLAIQEAITRYLLPRLFSHGDASVPDESAAPAQKDIDQCVASVRQLIELAKSSGAAVVVALHLEAGEKPGQEKHGQAILMHAAEAAGARMVDLGPAFNAARSRGQAPWRDGVHPSAAGQQIIAEALAPEIESVLRKSTTSPTSRAATMDSRTSNR